MKNVVCCKRIVIRINLSKRCSPNPVAATFERAPKIAVIDQLREKTMLPIVAMVQCWIVSCYRIRGVTPQDF